MAPLLSWAAIVLAAVGLVYIGLQRSRGGAVAAGVKPPALLLLAVLIGALPTVFGASDVLLIMASATAIALSAAAVRMLWRQRRSA
jgi:uncharacterized membrane protein